jgi:SSS family solute:Na+ symporter
MEQVQLIFSLFSAPFLAIFLLGMAYKKTTATAALAGFFSGAGVALLHQFLVWRHCISYGSIMSSDFHAAIYSFTTSLTIGLLGSRKGVEQNRSGRPALVFHWSEAVQGGNTSTLLALAGLLLVACIALNVIWR